VRALRAAIDLLLQEAGGLGSTLSEQLRELA
jgi:hypothetical protein